MLCTTGYDFGWLYKNNVLDWNFPGFLTCKIVFSLTDAKGLSAVSEVEQLREKVYASLEEYCKMHYPDEPGRFAKLLLRLPALRSIGLKCLEHLFFFKLIGDTPIDTFLLEMLESPSPSSTWLWSSIPTCVL